jgi:hypothetical protein
MLKLLSIFSLLGIILLSFFAWYSADDLYSRIELARHSIAHIALFQYLNWDGRSLSLAAFVQLFAVKNFPAAIPVLLWSISFVASAYMIRMLIRLMNPSVARLNAIVEVAIIAVIMWLGMWKLIGDIIYWPTGGSYSFMNLVGLTWLYIFLSDIQKQRFNFSRCVFIFFLSLVCGDNSHNLITGMLMIVVIELLNSIVIRKNIKSIRYITFSLMALLIAAAFVFLAPGNATRLSEMSYEGFSMRFPFYYALVLAKYGYWLLPLALLSIFIRWISNDSLLRNPPEMSFRFTFKTFVKLIHQHKFLVAALATASMFSATPYFATPRTAIFFGTFFILWFFGLEQNKMEITGSRKFIRGTSLLFICFCSILIFQLIKAAEIKNQLGGRELIFLTNKNKDVIVDAVAKEKVPFAFTFTDISSDSSYWVNRCVANYFGLKSVRTK